MVTGNYDYSPELVSNTGQFAQKLSPGPPVAVIDHGIGQAICSAGSEISAVNENVTFVTP